MSILFNKWDKFLGEAKKDEWDSAHVALIKGTKVLLLQRTHKDGWMPGKWSFPGGKLEKGETLEQGLAREVEEETGLKIDLENLSYLPEVSYKQKHAYYACSKYSGKFTLNFNGSEEHEDMEWVAKNEINDLPTTPDVKSVVEEAFKVLGD